MSVHAGSRLAGHDTNMANALLVTFRLRFLVIFLLGPWPAAAYITILGHARRTVIIGVRQRWTGPPGDRTIVRGTMGPVRVEFKTNFQSFSREEAWIPQLGGRTTQIARAGKIGQSAPCSRPVTTIKMTSDL